MGLDSFWIDLVYGSVRPHGKSDFWRTSKMADGALISGHGVALRDRSATDHAAASPRGVDLAGCRRLCLYGGRDLLQGPRDSLQPLRLAPAGHPRDCLPLFRSALVFRLVFIKANTK